MTDAAPEAVKCPCGNGYAERRKTPITEKIASPGKAERGRRITVLYRHDGCPVGGHLVVEDGDVVRRAGPLFTADRYPQRQSERDHPRSVADGGEQP